MLTQPEELLLLTIHHDKGTYLGSATERMKFGLVGAILIELALKGKIQSDSSQRLSVLDGEPTGDSLLDDVLTAIKEAEKNRKVGYWVNNLAQKPEKYRKQIAESLIEKGILTQEEDHFTWVIPSPFHPAINASTKTLVIRRCREIVLAQDAGAPPEIAFLSLARACSLLDLIFLKDERRDASNRINELVVRSAMTDPLFQTAQEIETAISVIVEED
jgi:golgi phosphoprotein 3